jgi:hypothetical protein
MPTSNGGLNKPETMSNISEKMKLLQEQIDNLEKSGFFTEADMDRLSKSHRIELELLMDQKPKQCWQDNGRDLLISKG